MASRRVRGLGIWKKQGDKKDKGDDLQEIKYSLFPVAYLAKIIMIKLYKASKFVNYARFFIYCRE
ncbi:hypothetical protein CEN46_13715 [Fischerella thermalis CCMEE 5318]|uniref:Uncharacterized protein n=1 Tax=Fischerella thermalis CCMEE 5318 TaxID=2019666 RepID=A0A2N6LEK1_9CYAN|nr:hypothetical protein CEN46_13715 [Fischerella thermalis CCMEE 5318]PMB25780.1 hypothetical protein CEN47_16540 [Fischerella thermalis CCMEE 5319]